MHHVLSFFEVRTRGRARTHSLLEPDPPDSVAVPDIRSGRRIVPCPSPKSAPVKSANSSALEPDPPDPDLKRPAILDCLSSILDIDLPPRSRIVIAGEVEMFFADRDHNSVRSPGSKPADGVLAKPVESAAVHAASKTYLEGTPLPMAPETSIQRFSSLGELDVVPSEAAASWREDQLSARVKLSQTAHHLAHVFDFPLANPIDSPHADRSARSPISPADDFDLGPVSVPTSFVAVEDSNAVNRPSDGEAMSVVDPRIPHHDGEAMSVIDPRISHQDGEGSRFVTRRTSREVERSKTGELWSTGKPVDENFEAIERSPDDVLSASDERRHPTETSPDSLLADGPARSKKGSNHKSDELRRIWRQNEGKTIEEVTIQLRHDLVDLQSSASDKNKLLFGMLWTNRFCRRGQDAKVARDLVFAEYTDACIAAGVVPLNHANFGKCVSTVYPNMKIRRLGPRGESKYNYWGLELVQRPLSAPAGHPSWVGHVDGRAATPLVGPPLRLGTSFASNLGAGAAIFAAPNTNLAPENPRPRRAAHNCLFMNLLTPSLRDLVEPDNLVGRDLFLPSSFDPGPTSKTEIDISLPPLAPFEAGMERSVIDELLASFRANCVSSVEYFLGARRALFYQSVAWSAATLTNPMRLLLDHPFLTPWVARCDKMMYQMMVRCLPRLIFTQIPGSVVKSIKKMSEELVPRLLQEGTRYSPRLLHARCRGARVFTSVLERFIRVYEAIQPVAGILTERDRRDRMYHDWMTSVDILRIVQNELPACGHLEVIDVLTIQVRALLEPLSLSGAPGDEPASEPQIHTILERWGNLLLSLPRRFPDADTERLLSCTRLISMAAVEDLARMECPTFTQWMTVRKWLDEMVGFYAEAGGFLLPAPAAAEGLPTLPYAGIMPTGLPAGPPRWLAGDVSDFDSSVGFSADESGTATATATATSDFPIGDRTGAAAKDAFTAMASIQHSLEDSAVHMDLPDDVDVLAPLAA
ncbi:MAG: hypothetical protein M1826_004109 [Phylliscum demangeonii]|nr:MAG: hypothetical protein M1826_004109 [Phylliscum demangeonii]